MSLLVWRYTTVGFNFFFNLNRLWNDPGTKQFKGVPPEHIMVHTAPAVGLTVRTFILLSVYERRMTPDHKEGSLQCFQRPGIQYFRHLYYLSATCISSFVCIQSFFFKDIPCKIWKENEIILTWNKIEWPLIMNFKI